MNVPVGPPHNSHAASTKKDPRERLLDILIGVLVVLVAIMIYSLLQRHILMPPVDVQRSGVAGGGIIQLDVLNGCGVSGVATTWTNHLRARGYDVVEMRNYKSFDVEESLVIDRTGNLSNAEKIAYALGIKKQNIIQQINQDYYVDVSVVIGKDFNSLKPSH